MAATKKDTPKEPISANSIANTCKNCLEYFTIAALQAQNKSSITKAYDGAVPKSKSPKIWMNYESMLESEEKAAQAAAKKEKVDKTNEAELKLPITSLPEARHMLAGFLMASAEAIKTNAKEISIEALMAADTVESAAIRLMHRTVTRMADQLSVDPLVHDHSTVEMVQHSLNLILGMRLGATTPATARAEAKGFFRIVEPISKLLVKFLKCVGWASAVMAFEDGGANPKVWSLKRKSLRTILALFGDTGIVKEYVCTYASAFTVKSAADAASADPEEAGSEEGSEDESEEAGSEEESEDEAPQNVVVTKPAVVATKPAVVTTKPAVVATKPAVVATKPAVVATKSAMPAVPAKKSVNLKA